MDLHFVVHSDGGRSSKARVGRHELQFDMPPGLGGDGKGPGPLAYFVVSTAACFHYAASGVLVKHDVVTDELEVHIHTTMAPDKRIATMRLEVRLPRGLGEDVRAAVDEVVRTCPIHNTLADPPRLEIETLLGE